MDEFANASAIGSLSAAVVEERLVEDWLPVEDRFGSAAFHGLVPPAFRIASISCSCGVGFAGSTARRVLLAAFTADDAEGFSDVRATARTLVDAGSPETDTGDLEVSASGNAVSAAVRAVIGTDPPASRMAIISCSCKVNLGGGRRRAIGLTGRNDDAVATAAGLTAAPESAADSEFAAEVPTGA